MKSLEWSAFLSLDLARAGLPWPPCLRGPFSDLLLACSFPQARSLTGAHASPSIPLSKPCSAVRTLEFPALMALNQLQELMGPLLLSLTLQPRSDGWTGVADLWIELWGIDCSAHSKCKTVPLGVESSWEWKEKRAGQTPRAGPTVRVLPHSSLKLQAIPGFLLNPHVPSHEDIHVK